MIIYNIKYYIKLNKSLFILFNLLLLLNNFDLWLKLIRKKRFIIKFLKLIEF